MSPTLVRRRVGSYPDSMTGLTRITFDPSDYVSATMFGDPVTQFIDLQELDAAGTVIGTSPVFIVPPASFFATGRTVLTVRGTAPGVAGHAGGFPPPGTGRFVLPKFSDEVTVYNTHAADPLYVAFGEGRQESTITVAAASRTFTEAGAWNMFIRGDGGDAPTFEITFAIVNGLSQ